MQTSVTASEHLQKGWSAHPKNEMRDEVEFNGGLTNGRKPTRR
jgi:hypothetical protein